MGQTALAHIAHPDLLWGAGVAGKGNNVDQRGLIVLLRHHAVLQMVDGRGVFIQIPQRQADGQAQPLADDGALHQNILAVTGHLARDDLMGQASKRLPIVAALKGHPRHLGKNLAANVVDYGMHSSHPSFLLRKIQIRFFFNRYHTTISCCLTMPHLTSIPVFCRKNCIFV